MSVLALIPARAGSRGIPGKNLRSLGGQTLIELAVMCAIEAGCEICVSSDLTILPTSRPEWWAEWSPYWLQRPAELATDTASMIDVVKHALSVIPGEPDQIICLLQPTQPFRTAAHIQRAIALLQETGADSVVSIVELPKTHSPDAACCIIDRTQDLQRDCWGELHPYMGVEQLIGRYVDGKEWDATIQGWVDIPTRRQDVRTAYRRDGTVYAFMRRTVENYGSIYGGHCWPLIIDPSETCELDTESDWLEVERRWLEKGSS